MIIKKKTVLTVITQSMVWVVDCILLCKYVCILGIHVEVISMLFAVKASRYIIGFHLYRIAFCRMIYHDMWNDT